MEENISAWRRTICGDLTAAFHTTGESHKEGLPFIERNAYLKGIYQAQFKETPKGFRQLTQEALKQSASNAFFGNKSAGAPFTVYTPNAIHSYAVAAGDCLSDLLQMDSQGQEYAIGLHGPNGFFRFFQNKGEAPELILQLTYEIKNHKPTGNIVMHLENEGNKALTIFVYDNAYGNPVTQKILKAQEKASIEMSLINSFCWYDLRITVEGYPNFSWNYAGRVETGERGYSDPQLSRITIIEENNKA